MAQTILGAQKIAAKKVGLSLQEYLQKINNGFKMCVSCRYWKLKKCFNSDRSRYDELQTSCKDCKNLRKCPKRVGAELNRCMKKLNLFYCNKCRKWLPISFKRSGLCKEHYNEYYRSNYKNTDAGKKIRERVNARKRGIMPIEQELKQNLYEIFKGLCGYCRKNPIDSWDHLVPISIGGDSYNDNIVPCCKSCNSSKNNKNVLEWMLKKKLKICDELESILILNQEALLRFPMDEEDEVLKIGIAA